jgi:hypothetical protein
MSGVYRFYGADDELLYIGCSRNVSERIRVHMANQPWAGDIVRHTIDWYPSRAEAYVAEQQAILAESPRYNKARWSSPDGPVRLTRKTIPTSICLDAELISWLKEDGRRNARTVSQQVRYYLHKAKEMAA